MYADDNHQRVLTRRCCSESGTLKMKHFINTFGTCWVTSVLNGTLNEETTSSQTVVLPDESVTPTERPSNVLTLHSSCNSSRIMHHATKLSVFLSGLWQMCSWNSVHGGVVDKSWRKYILSHRTLTITS